ncbi:MAG: CopG family transcriptional regulator [Candidatus Sumerlaeota bacterium]|nr:CopG family transcriptional regulator [Candidatus Sumerlaeota bacterium]
MIRTQVYLTEQERAALIQFSARSGMKQCDIIRQALQVFFSKSERSRRQKTIERVAGLWKKRKDLPDFSAIRASWDRG